MEKDLVRETLKETTRALQLEEGEIWERLAQKQ